MCMCVCVEEDTGHVLLRWRRSRGGEIDCSLREFKWRDKVEVVQPIIGCGDPEARTI